MKFKKNYINPNKHYIMIKRSIEVDDTLKKFIFTNSNYRRKVWNDFVREYYRCKDCGEEFDAMKYRTVYFNTVEIPRNIYNVFTVDISKQVTKDIIDGLKICKTQHGKLKFKKFNRFKCSFKVQSRSQYLKRTKNQPDSFNSRVYIDSDDQISFRVRAGEFIQIKLKEPLFYDAYPIEGVAYYFTKKNQYAFSNEDIKEISFIHELGKFYIQLTVEVFNLYNKKKEITKRKNIAGIDLGIHNPMCITDEDETYVLRMSNKELNRIHYLERRLRRLQSIMDRKTYGSKNYYKVLRKFRVTHYKIRNIRLNWRRKLSKFIATRYKKICVDKYSIPTKDLYTHLPKVVSKKLNSFNRLHGMYLFSESLIHACYKYKTKYYKSPEYTTRTCCRCGYINDKLPLSERYLTCTDCGLVIDRDVNASKNCYNYLLEL